MVIINLGKELGCDHEGFNWEKNRHDVNHQRRWASNSVSLLKATPNVITQTKTEEVDGYQAVQVGFGDAKRVAKPQLVIFEQLKLAGRQKFAESLDLNSHWLMSRLAPN